MATTITGTVSGLGKRRISLLVSTKFVGYASIGGKKVKVTKTPGKGNRHWTVA